MHTARRARGFHSDVMPAELVAVLAACSQRCAWFAKGAQGDIATDILGTITKPVYLGQNFTLTVAV